MRRKTIVLKTLDTTLQHRCHHGPILPLHIFRLPTLLINSLQRHRPQTPLSPKSHLPFGWGKTLGLWSLPPVTGTLFRIFLLVMTFPPPLNGTLRQTFLPLTGTLRQTFPPLTGRLLQTFLPPRFWGLPLGFEKMLLRACWSVGHYTPFLGSSHSG